MDILRDEPLGWKPFDMEFTCGEWEQVVQWFIEKTALEDLYKSEEK
jgi:hypothetical protein